MEAQQVLKMKRYSELVTIPTFEGRLAYLLMHGSVGAETFGFDRIFNQMFYRSQEWRRARDRVIVRDMGFDLGVNGFTIPGPVLVHHMNPIRLEDISSSDSGLFDPEFLITVSLQTHNAIHYGTCVHEQEIVTRFPNDTKLWRSQW